MLRNVRIDQVLRVTEHFDDDGSDAVAGLAAVEIVDFQVSGAGGGAPDTRDGDGDGPNTGMYRRRGGVVEDAAVENAVGQMHVSVGENSWFERRSRLPTYVPALVLPSLAQSWLLGSTEDETTGIAMLRSKVVIHDIVRVLMFNVG